MQMIQRAAEREKRIPALVQTNDWRTTGREETLTDAPRDQIRCVSTLLAFLASSPFAQFPYLFSNSRQPFQPDALQSITRSAVTNSSAPEGFRRHLFRTIDSFEVVWFTGNKTATKSSCVTRRRQRVVIRRNVSPEHSGGAQKRRDRWYRQGVTGEGKKKKLKIHDESRLDGAASGFVHLNIFGGRTSLTRPIIHRFEWIKIHLVDQVILYTLRSRDSTPGR